LNFLKRIHLIEKFQDLTFVNLYFFFTNKNHKGSTVILCVNWLIINFDTRYLFIWFNFFFVLNEIIDSHIHNHRFASHFTKFLRKNTSMTGFSPNICLNMYTLRHLSITQTFGYVILIHCMMIILNHVLIIYKNVTHIWIILI